MQVADMKTKLEEKTKTLESEKNLLLEEVEQFREVVELSEKAKVLEGDVNKLKEEVKTLKDRVPLELLQELGETTSQPFEDGEEECSGCDEEELL